MAKKSAKKSGRPSNCTINVKLARSHKNPKVLILRASGKFCSHESLICGDKFAENLNMAFASSRRKFVLNLAGITVLDAVGIGVLVTFIGKCNKSDTKLVMCTARQCVKDKLMVTRLIYVVPYYEAEEEALKSFD